MKMKGTLAVLLLVSVVDASPHWGSWNKLFKPPKLWSEPPFVTSVHTETPPGHMQIPPDHVHSFCPPTVLPVGNCNIAWMCRNPESGDIMITDINGTQFVINGQFQQDKSSDQCAVHSNKNPRDENLNSVNCNDKNTDNNRNVNKENPEITTVHTPFPQTKTNKSPRGHGGEGLIDIRMGGD